MGHMRNAYRILVEKPERKRQFRRPRLRWEDNIEVDFKETDNTDVDWIYLSLCKNQLRALVNTVINIRVPSKAGNFLIS
jgi:hypothetical protein